MDLEKLRKCVECGMTYSEIAKQMGYAKSTIFKNCKKLGITANTDIARANDPQLVEAVKNLVNEGKTNLEIAKTLNISPTTSRRYTEKLLNLNTNSVRAKQIKDVSLSSEQLEILYGSLLGDMSIEKKKKGSRINITQGGIHKEYFDHLCEVFKGLLGKVDKTKRYDKRTNKFYNKFIVRTLTHKYYSELRSILYINDTKTINKQWVDKLTWRSIAYWFMDDGDINGVFATNCFTLSEVETLKEMFLHKFNIHCRIHKVSKKE